MRLPDWFERRVNNVPSLSSRLSLVVDRAVCVASRLLAFLAVWAWLPKLIAGLML